MEFFDVAVVGAGIGGSSVLPWLEGKKVLLLDRASGPGSMEKSSATFVDVIQDFGLEAQVKQWYRRFVFKTPRYTMEKDLGKPFYGLMDYGGMCSELIERAEVGNEVVKRFGEPLVSVKRNNGSWQLQSSKGNYSARVLVDATGTTGVVGRQLGVHRPSRIHYYCSVAGFEESAFPLDTFYFFAGSDYHSNYAGWVYPEKRVSEVGIASFLTDFRNGKGIGKNHLLAFKHLKNDDSLFSGFVGKAREVKFFEHAYPAVNGQKTFSDSFLSVGDAAQQTLPHFGGGIEGALNAGKIAGGVINDSFRENDFSEKFFSRYDREWRKWYGASYLVSLVFLNNWPNWSDGDWKQQLEKFDELSPESLISVFRAKPRAALEFVLKLSPLFLAKNFAPALIKYWREIPKYLSL